MSSQYLLSSHELRSISDVTEKRWLSQFLWWTQATHTGVDHIFDISTKKEKPVGRSEDLCVQKLGAITPMHHWSVVSSKEQWTSKLQCGGTSSCWNITFGCKGRSFGKTNCFKLLPIIRACQNKLDQFQFFDL